MHDSRTTGYHLFLEPTGALRDTLATLIEQLALAHGGPIFPPHVTLVGPLEGTEETIRSRVEAAVRDTAPFTLTLGELDGEDAFFRALYMRISKEGELMRLRERMGASTDTYEPHLSLFYGSIDHVQRASMIREIEYPQSASILVDRIHLYRTEGTADTWEHIAEFVFS